jgi:hypothetical protein
VSQQPPHRQPLDPDQKARMRALVAANGLLLVLVLVMTQATADQPSTTGGPGPTDTGGPGPTDTGGPGPTDTGGPGPTDTGGPGPTDTGGPGPTDTGGPGPTDTGGPGPTDTSLPITGGVPAAGTVISVLLLGVGLIALFVAWVADRDRT